MDDQQRRNDDLESGVRFRLNTDSYDNDLEPIPDLGLGDDSSSNGRMTASFATVPEHTTVVNHRMTTIEYLWRRHVRSRTNNTNVQAMLDRILLLFLFLASLVEQPLMYLLGNTQKQPAKSNPPKSYKPPIGRGTTKTPLGTIAYTISQGRNPKNNPVLCFHSESRSTDEFLEVLPLMAETGRRVVALDFPGHGWSENPNKSCTIDDIADAFLKVADALLIEQFVVLGSSSMGTSVATSLAARYQTRVRGCIQVNLLYNPARTKDSSTDGTASSVDELGYKDDGAHLLDLHTKRKFLDPDLNLRCVQSDLTQIVNRRARQIDGVTVEEASQFDLESAARKLRCPTLCVSGESALATLDARGLGGTQRFDTACRMLPHCEVNSLTGPRSTLYMMNQAPKEFVSLCAGFLEKHGL